MNRSKSTLKLASDDLKRVFVRTGLRLLRESRLESPLHELAWLQKSVGIIIESRGLPEILAGGRAPIPGGVMARRTLYSESANEMKED